MREIKWRFPGNNHATESGLNTAEMETFKKDSISSLAREICQNSIDARNDKTKPVLVEFSLFEIKKNQIPGFNRLEAEIENCYEYTKKNVTLKKAFDHMKFSLMFDDLSCLRISDFNTNGLLGVEDNSKAFYSLTKESGISYKTGTTGGSKGIGKFASFVNSDINTVFYSTLTKEGNKGYLGIAKLCSAPIAESSELTMGIGYYSIDEKNSPILEDFSLDSKFYRDSEPGTDLYILSFKGESNWKSLIISKVLDSFICAIYYESLVVKVGEFLLSKQTLKDIVYDESLILAQQRKSIISQYLLLTDSNAIVESFDIMNYGEIELRLKSFPKEEADLATKDCQMIRYPFMKIKTQSNISSLPCSAICIIKDNDLNEFLREIENPEHTDWQPNRHEDYALKYEARAVIKNIKDTIKKFVVDNLSSSDNSETDIDGAGEFLPDDEIESGFGDEPDNKSEIVEITKPKRKKIASLEAQFKSDIDEGLMIDDGDFDNDGNEGTHPQGNNKGSGNEPAHGEIDSGISDGDSEILKYTHLTGIKYRLIVIDKDKGKYNVVFTSPLSVEKCDLELFLIDDSNKKTRVLILSASQESKDLTIVSGKIKGGINLSEGKKTTIELVTNQYELFSGEVEIYAYR